MSFLPGMEVVLKSGSPVMTVESVSSHDPDDTDYVVTCIWFGGKNKVRKRDFYAYCLIDFDEVRECCEEDDEPEYPTEEEEELR